MQAKQEIPTTHNLGNHLSLIIQVTHQTRKITNYLWGRFSQSWTKYS